MSANGPVEAFVERLGALARGERLDYDRLAGEAADHLAEAAARYRRAGLDRDSAARRAIREFGDPAAMVKEIAAAKEGAMKGSWVKASTRAALAATVTLLATHVLPSQSVSGTPFQVLADVADAVLGLALLAIAAVWWRRLRVRSSALILWAGAVAALGALSGWRGDRIDLGFVVIHVSGRPYLAFVAVLMLAVVGVARSMDWPAGGAGLILASFVGLTANGIMSHDWQPAGAIGEGQANMPVVLLVVGWALLGVSWVRGPGGTALRSSLATWLTLLARKLAPTGPPAVEADR